MFYFELKIKTGTFQRALDTGNQRHLFIITFFMFCSVFDAYEKIAEVSIEDSIKSELSGDFERLMLAVGKRQTDSTTLHRDWCVVNVTQCSLLVFSHSPVHKEHSHVLCQATLLVNEGKSKFHVMCGQKISYLFPAVLLHF